MRTIKHLPTTLLITGGTGSLGNAIVERLLGDTSFDYVYEKIIIFSRDEQKQNTMFHKFKDKDKHNKLRYFVGDVRDKDRLTLAVKEATHIIHTAAMKIVPAVEYNPFEAIKTNIVGSQNLIEVCEASSTVEKVLAISTDKAVSPINLYGATKLAAEKLFIAANEINKGYGPRYSVARYGNVANSNGSVIPFFKSCLEKGELIPITHPDMTRFWITLEQASKFVLDRLYDMKGEEIFIPDMKSFKVVDLAYKMLVQKYGLWDLESGIKTKIVGIRQGEKIHEDIITKYEIPFVSDHQDYFIINKTQIATPTQIKDIVECDEILGIGEGYNSTHNLMTDWELINNLMVEGVIDYISENNPPIKGTANV